MLLRPRHFRRYREIAEVLADHGFGAILVQLGISERLNIPRRILRRKPTQEEELSLPRRLRLALADLGPTFVKVGQILSTRSDLLPPQYLDELSYLQDDVSPLPWETVREVVEAELGLPVSELFTVIDPIPIAAASIAQVHAAMLPNGDQVVVKIQRPGIEQTIDTDLAILYEFARLAQERTTIGERFEVADLAEEFAYALRTELDFRREARNADRFRENFTKEDKLYVPRIYWDYTTGRVLVMERISGIKITDIPTLLEAGYDRRELANNSAWFVLKEVLEDGFFHADPHPGNLLILPGGVLGVLDFGTMGRLDNRDRINLARLFIVAVQLDAEGIVDQLMRMGVADYRVDRVGLQRDLRRLLIRYQGLKIYEINAAEVMDGLEPIIYEHKLRIPSDYWLLIKTVVIMQGVGLNLDPEFDIFAFAQPFLGKVLRQLWLPSTWGPSILRLGTDWGDFLSNFPRQTARILNQLDRGDFVVQVEVPELEETNRRLEGIVNRIIYAILLAALTVSLALLIPRLDLSWPWGLFAWIIVAGFMVMAFLSLRLLWSIFRSGRRRRNNRRG
jgi:ubiquinone biosynthesis protein